MAQGNIGLILVCVILGSGDSRIIVLDDPQSVTANDNQSFIPSDPSLLTLGEDPPSQNSVRALLAKLLKQFEIEGNRDDAVAEKPFIKDKKVWTFAFSNDGFPANFIDTDGQLVGQSVDIVKKICAMARKECRMIIVPRAYCWNDGTSPGTSTVLNQHQYDVCANLVESPARKLGYTFPKQSIYKIPHPIIIVKPKSKITLDKLRTCHKFTVAYPSLTAVNKDCLLAAGFYVRPNKARPVEATGSIVGALNKIVELVLTNKVDVGLVMPRLLTRPEDVKILGDAPCLNVAIGLNMMARVDDLEFVSWWENTLKRFICKGGKRYAAFCQEQQSKYGVDPLCFKPGTEVNCQAYGYMDFPTAPVVNQYVDPCK